MKRLPSSLSLIRFIIFLVKRNSYFSFFKHSLTRTTFMQLNPQKNKTLTPKNEWQGKDFVSEYTNVKCHIYKQQSSKNYKYCVIVSIMQLFHHIWVYNYSKFGVKNFNSSHLKKIEFVHNKIVWQTNCFKNFFW